MPKVFVPTSGPEEWKHLLTKPDLHWKRGRSARSTAYSWEAANALPGEIETLLETCPQFNSESPELLAAFPEWKVPLPGGDRDSQSDVFALVRCGTQTLAVAIEAKVSETFGPTVAEWLVNASDGKKERLAYLCERLGLDQNGIGALRYQLFHRTVSAIIERDRFGMDVAAMIVHSFSQTHEWIDDYQAFVRILGGSGERGVLDCVQLPDGQPLHLGWATGDAQFLEA